MEAVACRCTGKCGSTRENAYIKTTKMTEMEGLFPNWTNFAWTYQNINSICIDCLQDTILSVASLTTGNSELIK